MNWIVAKAAYYSWLSEARRKEILDGQVAATNNYNIFLGPNTDEMQGDLRASDKVHFSEKGLIEHGTRWADAIIEKLFTSKKIVAENTTNGSFL